MREVVWILPLLIGCVHGSAAQPAGEGQPARGLASVHDGSSPERAFLACTRTRSDYRFVAETRCDDGSRPAHGDIREGGAARLGNIGAGPDGHILDEYELACSNKRIRLYVDGYHCTGGLPTDRALSTEERAALIRAIQDAHDHPLSDEAFATIADVGMWVQATHEISATVCMQMVESLVPKGYQAWRLLGAHYLLGLVEEAVLRPDLAPRERHVRAARAALATYGRYASERPALAHPALDRLAAEAAQGVPDVLTRAAAACML